MPFVSQAQRGFMFENHPDIAQRWSAEYPNQGPLPQQVDKHSKVVAALMNRKHAVKPSTFTR